MLARTTICGALVAACLELAACQPAPTLAQPDPVPVNGVGYLIFNTTITPVSRDLFIRDVDKLHEAGAHEIDLAINSPGGQIDAAQEMVAYMNRLHQQAGVTFKAYNIGLVASAATYVFLNAQARYAQPRSAFLFHAAGMVSNGAVSAERLREAADKLDDYERVMRETMRAHTRLTDVEATTYLHRTVILGSDDARRDGIIDAVAPLNVPTGSRAWMIRSNPPPGGGRPATAPAQPMG